MPTRISEAVGDQHLSCREEYGRLVSRRVMRDMSDFRYLNLNWNLAKSIVQRGMMIFCIH